MLAEAQLVRWRVQFVARRMQRAIRDHDAAIGCEKITRVDEDLFIHAVAIEIESCVGRRGTVERTLGEHVIEIRVQFREFRSACAVVVRQRVLRGIAHHFFDRRQTMLAFVEQWN